jgi:hypothetical protein
LLLDRLHAWSRIRRYQIWGIDRGSSRRLTVYESKR